MIQKMFSGAGKYFLGLGLCLAVTSAGAARRYVKPSQSGNGNASSWANASSNLQDVINSSAEGDEVWVAAGTYLPTRDPLGLTSPSDVRDKTFFLRDGVKLYGGFVGTETVLAQRFIHLYPTILSGNIDNDNTVTGNSYHVVVAAPSSGTAIGVTIDGFTITGGNANVAGNYTVNGNGVARNQGAGMNIYHGTNTISNNRIYGNSVTSWGGGVQVTGAAIFINNIVHDNSSGNICGGARFVNAGSTITGNVIYNNTSIGTGAGLFVQPSGTLISTVSNNLIFNNTSNSWGGGLFASIGVVYVSNNTFYGNAATNNGGGVCANNNTITLSNNLFAANTKGGNSGTTGADFGYNVESAGDTRIAINNILQLSSIAYVTTGTGVGNQLTTSTNNKFAVDPLFSNAGNILGADGIPMTADDGLRVNCGSPALLSGVIGANIPTVDIFGTIRGAANVTIGAYEGAHINAAPAATAKTLTVTHSGLGSYGACGDYLSAAVLSNGGVPLSGSVTSKTWVEASQGGTYVKRHFELAPAVNAGTATGKVTLYFTQADFDAFNAVASVDLPTGTADATGKANLKVERWAGVSNNNTGLPATYTGPMETIDPLDADIVWNSTFSRWEVSFQTTGFGGFLLKTVDAPLPLQLLGFTAAKNGERNRLTWNTATEEQGTVFTLLRSADGVDFSPIGTVAGDGTGSYAFEDASPLSPIAYYKLKCSSPGAGDIFSDPASVRRSLATARVTVSPNPAKDVLTLMVTGTSLIGSQAAIYDTQGRKLLSFKVEQRKVISISNLALGTYLIRLADGTSLKFVKQ